MKKTSYPQTETTKDSNCPNPIRQVHFKPDPNRKVPIHFLYLACILKVWVSNLGLCYGRFLIQNYLLTIANYEIHFNHKPKPQKT